MIAALLSEGFVALRNAGGTAQHRIRLGLERPDFVSGLVFGAGITILSVIVPELSGVSAAADRAMGDNPSDIMLAWPMLISMVVAVAVVTAAIIWRGPQLTDGLARMFGGQSTLMGAAIWLYLATAAGVVISLAIMVTDLMLGLAALAWPSAVGLMSLGIAVAGLVASWAVSAQLAQHVFGIPSHLRSLVFVLVWTGASLLLLAAIWVFFYGLLGGATS